MQASSCWKWPVLYIWDKTSCIGLPFHLPLRCCWTWHPEVEPVTAEQTCSLMNWASLCCSQHQIQAPFAWAGTLLAVRQWVLLQVFPCCSSNERSAWVCVTASWAPPPLWRQSRPACLGLTSQSQVTSRATCPWHLPQSRLAQPEYAA